MDTYVIAIWCKNIVDVVQKSNFPGLELVGTTPDPDTKWGCYAMFKCTHADKALLVKHGNQQRPIWSIITG